MKKKYVKPKISGVNHERAFIPLLGVAAAAVGSMFTSAVAAVAAAEVAVGTAATVAAAGAGFMAAVSSKNGDLKPQKKKSLLKVESNLSF